MLNGPSTLECGRVALERSDDVASSALTSRAVAVAGSSLVVDRSIRRTVRAYVRAAVHDGVMAGGMSKRGNWGPMSERIRQPKDASSPPAPAGLKHCWVTDRHGRLPALLLEWRRTASEYEGRVVRPVHDGDGWIVVEEWLPASQLEPT
jgi:hypothetical protein